ncbi:MAG TPA: exodeoxyribonuclease III [Candidatus Saccharimonadales bacterium]|jgi:exodeoxyribonuclease-3|nr:exodeoxyribonuclease III [Candidatus Saccharimonadales bacterium]
MKIYSWNVNGIRAVEKKGALAEFITREQPDIICFQEIKAHEAQLDVEYPEYEKYWNSAKRAGYSGTAIWTKVAPLNVSYDMPEALIDEYKLDTDEYGDPSDEGRVTTLEFEDFYLSTVYTPNSKGDLSRLALRYKQWDPAFLQYMKRREEKKPVIFCGDLNVAHTELDLANPKPNIGKHGFTNEEREGFDNILNTGFVDTFRMFNKEGGNYTWWTHWANSRARNVGWRIDYILVSGSIQNRVKSAAIHAQIMGSDHCPVSITLDA